MHKQRFLQSTAGTIRLPLKIGEGPAASSNTIELFTPEGAVLQASAATTLSTIDTTIAVAVEEGDDTMKVTSATGFEVGKWAIIGTQGEDPQERRRVKRVSGTTVTFDEPFRFDHGASQTIGGAEITYTLTTTHTATLDHNYRAVWAYKDDAGDGHRVTQLFNVVAQIFKLPMIDLTVEIGEDIRKSAAELFDETALVDKAEERIIRDLERRGINADLIRHPDQFIDLAVYWVSVILLNRAAMNDPSFSGATKTAKADYKDELGALLESKLDWYDKDEDLSVSGANEDGTGEEEGVTVVRYLGIG